jgi:predicted DNA-binding protein with PD1-like motif
MVHPGPVAERRIAWAGSPLVEATGRVDGNGRSLLEVIASLARAHGVASGTGRIEHCALSATRFTTGGPARDGKAANYTFIRDLGAGHLTWGTFSFGRTPNGAPFVHCHAMAETADQNAPVGGHLFPADCVTKGDMTIELLGLPGIDLVQKPDAETLHSVFEIEAGAHDTGADALFVRVRPNEDVIHAIETACRAADVTDADIAPSLGSLNAPVLTGAGGKNRALSSVGMEVLAFAGTVRGGTATLDVVAVDEAGRPHEGRLARGLAPVCVTAEIALIRR